MEDESSTDVFEWIKSESLDVDVNRQLAEDLQPHLSAPLLRLSAKLCRRVFVSTLWGSAASFCGGPVVVLDEEPLSRMEPKF